MQQPWSGTPSSARYLGRLTSSEVEQRLSPASILCLPIGAWEQHGPHLPLDTDTILADRFACRVAERWQHQHDVWLLPPIPYGLSREHKWAAGTVSLSIRLFSDLLLGLCEEMAASTPAKNLLIVNGHGGNRGILDAMLYDIEDRFGFNACVTHPTALSQVRSGSPMPEVHGGMSETSVMLAIASDAVHMDRLPPRSGLGTSSADAIRELIMDRGASWAWRSDDATIASLGIIGEAHLATSELGRRIVESAVEEYGRVFERLAERNSRRE